MNIFNAMGIGETALLRHGLRTEGTVTAVKTWWFVKVNTKPVRAIGTDGARYPHRISFVYRAGGGEYQGSRILSPSIDAPAKGDKITVYYDPSNPHRYALEIQGKE